MLGGSETRFAARVRSLGQAPTRRCVRFLARFVPDACAGPYPARIPVLAVSVPAAGPRPFPGSVPGQSPGPLTPFGPVPRSPVPDRVPVSCDPCPPCPETWGPMSAG